MIFNLGAGENSWNSALNKLGAKNLITYPYNETTHTDNGIRWIDNGDGTITANGTATARSSFILKNSASGGVVLEKGDYIFSGCPSGGSTSTYAVNINSVKNNAVVTTIAKDVGNGATFTVDDTFSGIAIEMVILSGLKVENLVFKPMIRLASILDDTYEPYAMTNKELTESVEYLEKWSTPIPDIVQNDMRPVTSGRVFEYCKQTDTSLYNLSESINDLIDSLTPKSVDLSITCSEATIDTTNLKKVGKIVTGFLQVAFKTNVSTEFSAVVSGKDAPIQLAISYCYITSNALARAAINSNSFTFKNFGNSTYSSGWTMSIPFTWITN